MDRLERIDSLPEMLIAAMRGWQSDIWTAIPGIVSKFNADEMTCEVQPSVRFKILYPALDTYSSSTMIMDPSGQCAWDQMPLLLDCPVVFPGGGGVTLTFPINPGDEVLVIFASRCIDAWWQQGGIQNQSMFRMHDASDGFVIPQVRSQPRRFTVATGGAQLRTDDGTCVLELNPTAKTLNITAPGGSTINANVTINGDLHVTGTITGDVDVVGGGKSLKTHVHSGVTPGGSNTGTPV